MLVEIEREKEAPSSSSSPTSVMEKLQGLINPCLFGDHLDSQTCIDQAFTTTITNDLRYEAEEEAQQYLSGLKVRMPLIQMLQSIDHFPPSDFTPSKDPTFQALLRLQLQQVAEPLESCVTPQEQYLHSPTAKSEGQDNPHQNNDPLSVSTTTLEGGVSSYCNQLNSTKMRPKKSASTTPERQKRKRTRPTKNKEEVESQRMTHIAVERNRRRQMNDHLNVLRSLMPPSYIQRGDQASIVGGAIDFVKELEQYLQTLEAQKRMTKSYNNVDDPNNNKDYMTSSSSSSAAMSTMPSNGMFMSISQCRIGSTSQLEEIEVDLTAKNKCEAAEVDVTVIQNHVNLKVECQKRPGQLMRALVAFEDIIRLTVLHLNITSSSSDDKVLYCFNLKIEEACKLGSADEIAKAVYQIFSFIN